MEQLNGHLKDFPKNVILDEETMLSIARLIAYTIAGSKSISTAPPEMSKPSIELDARLVDQWLMKGEKYVCKKCESKG